jgi:hypothetical protein
VLLIESSPFHVNEALKVYHKGQHG